MSLKETKLRRKVLKMGTFTRSVRTKPRMIVATGDIRYGCTLQAVRTGSRRTKLPGTIIKVNGTDTEFIIDTGAGLNILDK